MSNPSAPSKRSALIPLMLATVFVFIGLALLAHFPTASDRTGSGSPQGLPPHARPVASPGSRSTAPPSEVASGIPVPGDGPAGDHAVQQLLNRSSPADLPRAQERDLVQLASQVWEADVTGRGQDRWPGYFATRSTTATRARDTYTGVRVQAGIARRARGGRVEVRLVWAGTGPSGEQRDGRTARLLLHRAPHHPTRWEPVR